MAQEERLVGVGADANNAGGERSESVSVLECGSVCLEHSESAGTLGFRRPWGGEVGDAADVCNCRVETNGIVDSFVEDLKVCISGCADVDDINGLVDVGIGAVAEAYVITEASVSVDGGE